MEEEFIPVMAEKDLTEGKMKLVSVEGEHVLLIKRQGHIYAIDNRCPHMGCGFVDGTLDDLVIVCPCHDWRFSLETGEYEEEPSMKLKFYKLKIEAGKIWVKLED
jgi:3-phenylpropionate/trans-cinnamate dioxygenase ferredoxin subunit